MSPIGPSGKSGGPAGVSSSTVIQTGNGSPNGVVTPSHAGAVYQDLTIGGLWVAKSTANTSWMQIGGYNVNGPFRVPGVQLTTDDAFEWAVQDSNGNTAFLIDDAADIAKPYSSVITNSNTLDDGSANGLATLQNLVVIHPTGVVNGAPQISQLSPKFTITSGALPTATLASGTAAQLSTTRDVESHTAVTFNPGVATTATCTVALSSDNTTFSTLCVVTKPVGTVFDGEIEDVVVRVPAGWYLKMTVVNATLGTTTYY